MYREPTARTNILVYELIEHYFSNHLVRFPVRDYGELACGCIWTFRGFHVLESYFLLQRLGPVVDLVSFIISYGVELDRCVLAVDYGSVSKLLYRWDHNNPWNEASPWRTSRWLRHRPALQDRCLCNSVGSKIDHGVHAVGHAAVLIYPDARDRCAHSLVETKFRASRSFTAVRGKFIVNFLLVLTVLQVAVNSEFDCSSFPREVVTCKDLWTTIVTHFGFSIMVP